MLHDSLSGHSGRRRRFTSGLTFGFISVFLILAAITGLFMRNFFFRVELTDMTIHPHRIIQHLAELQTDMSDAESAALSYSLAGREPYRSAYKTTMATVDKDLAQLRLTTAEHEEEVRELQMIERSVADIRRNLDLLLALPHAQIPANHLDSEDRLVLEAEKAIGTFHVMVERMQQDADRVLNARIMELKRIWNHTLVLLLSGIVLTTMIIGWLSFWTIRVETRTRRQAQQALERSHEELESRVRERTAQLVAANNRLSILSRQIIQVQEDERRRLARDLHDEIGQSLTAVKLNLQEIKDRSEGTQIEALAHDTLDVLGQLLQRVRSLALELRPSLLDELGLYDASKWYVKQLGRRTGLAVSFEAEGSMERLPEDIEIACFRVLQESLTNVIRHAHASTVSVKMSQAGDFLELRVRDDGVGFSFAEARARAVSGASLGLLGMEERLGLAGGSLEVLSAEGRGTEVKARLPLQQSRAEHALSQGRPAI